VTDSEKLRVADSDPLLPTNMSRITSHPLIKKLLSLNLPSEDYAIFGSGPMFAHGIKDLSHDVDIIARGKALDKASKIKFFDSQIEVFDNWGPGDWSIREKDRDHIKLIEDYFKQNLT